MRRLRGSSTFWGRCRVTRPYPLAARPGGRPCRRFPRRLELGAEGVDHHVADQPELLLGHPFAAQVRKAARLGDQQQVRHGVGEQAVDLLRHRAVEAPQAGLHVDHLDPELHRGEGAGHGAVHVAEDHRGLRPGLEQVRFVPLQDPRGLGAVASRARPRGARPARGCRARRRTRRSSTRRSAGPCARCARRGSPPLGWPSPPARAS